MGAKANQDDHLQVIVEYKRELFTPDRVVTTEVVTNGQILAILKIAQNPEGLSRRCEKKTDW